MDCDKFFVLEHKPYGTRWWWLNRAYDLGEKPDIDPVPHLPLRMRIFQGRSRPSVIANDAGALIVDAKMREVLEKAAGSRIRFGRVDVLEKRGDQVLDGSCSRVLAGIGAGPRSEERGYHLNIERPGLWKQDPELRDAFGLFFDYSTWTGEPVFRLPNDSHYIISARIKQHIDDAGLADCGVVNVEEYWRDHRDQTVSMLKARRSR